MATDQPDSIETDGSQSGSESVKSREADAVEAEVVKMETAETQLTQEAGALVTYSLSRGPLTFKLMPQVSDAGTDWVIHGFAEGVQGPIIEVSEQISPKAAQELGLSEDDRQRLNEALAYADRELSLSPDLGDKQRDARRLVELEQMMGENNE